MTSLEFCNDRVAILRQCNAEEPCILASIYVHVNACIKYYSRVKYSLISSGTVQYVHLLESCCMIDIITRGG